MAEMKPMVHGDDGTGALNSGGVGRAIGKGVQRGLAGDGVDVRWAEQGEASVRDFLTDGSLSRMCDEVARLTGVPIWLRDRDGQVIIPGDGAGPSGAGTWRLVDAEHGAMRAYALVGRAFAGGQGVEQNLFVAPLRTSVGEIGQIVMPADWGDDDPVHRRALERAVTLLGRTAVEACEGQIALQLRLNELDAMFRISSTLTIAGDPDKVLGHALDIAMDVLQLDAGSISTLEDPGPDASGVAVAAPGGQVLRHRAVRNLSERWLDHQAPISVDGSLRAAALRGEVVCVEDLRADPRIEAHDLAREENVVSLILTGLVVQGRPGGLLRLYSRSPRVFSKREQDLLRSIAEHAASVLATARLRELRRADREMQRQIKLAADVQKRMLPRQLPSIPGFDIAARYSPSFQIGGDFYDLFTGGPHGDQLGLILGDVVGKGVPAALIMANVRATARALAGVGLPLDQLMSAVNQALYRDTLEGEFVTLWCGMVDPHSKRGVFVSAGHDPAMRLRCGPDGQIQLDELESGGMAAGIDPEQTYTVGTCDVQAGDIVLVYTDGLTDAANFQDERFGKPRVQAAMMDLLTSEPNASASRVVEHLMWTLRQFRGLRLATDDVTLVVVRVTE